MKPLSEWGRIVIPPLLLASLLFAPPELLTTALWLALGIVVLFSLGQLLHWLVLKLRGKAQFHKEVLRPLLTVVVACAVVVLSDRSVERADNYGRELALAAQRTCQEKGKCPKSFPGFACHQLKKNTGRIIECSTTHGVNGARFRVLYRALEGRSRFHVYVRHARDGGLLLQGGVREELQEQFSSN